MTYYIYDANGYVGDLASTNGLRELRNYLESIEAPKIQSLLSAGYKARNDELLTEINSLATPDNPTVRETVSNLIALTNRCDEIIIITDGVFDDSEEMAKNKGLNLANEAQKARYWRKVDSRRRAWEQVLSKKTERLYSDMGRAIAKEIEGA